MKTLPIWPGVLFLLITVNCLGQTPANSVTKQTTHVGAPIDSSKQRDVIDLVEKVFKINSSSDQRTVAKKASFSIVPSVSYSLTTGYQADISSNVGFYTTSTHSENYSAITSDLTIDTKKQKLAVFRSEIWSRDNEYKFLSDTRWERFPETTYGLGTETTDADADPIDFKYVRNYFTIYKKAFGEIYAGAGYNLDYHYGIKEFGLADSAESGFKKYGLKSTSVSSGINLSLLFDNRQNALNPINGGFASVIYRQNPTFMGSDNNWQSLQFDLRRYFRTSPKNNNILAVWVLAWFTSGDVPYLDLPGTGKDMFKNSGRGYIEGRFVGKNMLYAETEYRFGLTSNGFLGAVVFANAESLSEPQTNQFKKIAPAAGTGLRFKINKHSNTNACLDYAVGIKGSNGFFLNLGEVF